MEDTYESEDTGNRRVTRSMTHTGWIDHPAPQRAETENQARNVEPQDVDPQDGPTTVPEAPTEAADLLVAPVEGATGTTGEVQSAASPNLDMGAILEASFQRFAVSFQNQMLLGLENRVQDIMEA